MSAWQPQASYPCGNFSDTSSLTIILKTYFLAKGSLGHDFSCYYCFFCFLVSCSFPNTTLTNFPLLHAGYGHVLMNNRNKETNHTKKEIDLALKDQLRQAFALILNIRFLFLLSLS